MSEVTKVVVFQVRNEDYAVPVGNVISIEKMTTVTPIPKLPKYVKGIFTVRDQLIPIIDFEQVLHNTDTKIGDDTKIVVIQTDALTIGAIVKEAKEIVDISAEHMKQLGLVGYEKTKFLKNIAHINNQLIAIIDPSSLVNSLEGLKEIQAYLDELKQEQQ